MILVIGGTGKVGGHLVRQLRDERAPVRVLVRQAARGEAARALGAEPVVGDVDDAATLDAAMRGNERPFLLTPPTDRQREQQRAAIDAARRAGVRRVVRLSVGLADPASENPLLRWHGETDAYLRDTAMDWTILRPPSFMHNVLAFAPTIAAEGRFYAPDAGRTPVVHPRDVAAVGARALLDDGHAGTAYEVTGQDALSWGDMAAALGRALGRDVAWVEVPPAAARGAMTGMGLPAWLADSLLGLYDAGARGEFERVHPTVGEVGRVAPTTFDAFAREIAPALQPSSGAAAPALQGR